MAPQQSAQNSAAKNVTKMPRLPASAKVTKRPLMRPAIPSPYTGRESRKIVYVGSKMAFMAGIHRVQSLLKQIDKRAIQSALESRRTMRLSSSNTAATPALEPVVIKASGKAIAKALQMANFLQKQPDLVVVITTSSVDAIDDIDIPEEETEAHTDDTPEARIRTVSVVEVSVSHKL